MKNILGEKLINKLNKDKIKINGNENPIEMDLFLSFLTVPTTISTEHLGYENGWTRRDNKEHNLIIYGALVNGENYLDAILYGKKLQNPYNNYVNPFYLLPIMNVEGVKFFIDYYEEEMMQIIQSQLETVELYENLLSKEKSLFMELRKNLGEICRIVRKVK